MILVVLQVASVACSQPTPAEGALGCVSEPLYNAAATPGLIHLTFAQQRSIGIVSSEQAPQGSGCTGTRIAPGWVLTAKHCDAGGKLFFTTGVAGEEARTVASDQVIPHPSLDLILFHEANSESATADNRAIPPISAAASASWVGDLAQLAGRGLTEAGTVGDLAFAVEPIIEVEDDALVVDGSDASGACIGDSGGPLLVLDDDGTERVAGVLSAGSSRCLGLDRYTRLDVVRDWLSSNILDDVPEARAACADTGTEGVCRHGHAYRCEAEVVRVDACAEACGWETRSGGFRCVASHSDPCRGVDSFGVCDGGRAIQCVMGQLVQTDCGCGVCRRSPADGVIGCM